MSFVQHEWEVMVVDDLAEIETATCPHCNMVRETVEDETTYKVPARTPSHWKPAVIPPGMGYPEPSCKKNLRALGLLLKDKALKREMDSNEGCCTAWHVGAVTTWECGGPGICDCETCHGEQMLGLEA